MFYCDADGVKNGLCVFLKKAKKTYSNTVKTDSNHDRNIKLFGGRELQSKGAVYLKPEQGLGDCQLRGTDPAVFVSVSCWAWEYFASGTNMSISEGDLFCFLLLGWAHK